MAGLRAPALLATVLLLIVCSSSSWAGSRALREETSNGGGKAQGNGGSSSRGGSGGWGSWQRGRTSWYGTPGWVEPFVSTRGGGRSAFGIVEWGGCGYTNGNGSLAFDQNYATAVSDDNPDWHGACGRCYEVRCVDGPVLGTQEVPIGLEHLYYYPKFALVPDEMGRSFPGNPTEAQNYYTVKCWNNSASIVVKVVDLCPCYYCPQGEPCRYQESCCYKRSSHPKAGQISFDLTFWAFQQLAHPEYGIMMIDFRPVDCGSHQPVSYIPGYISRTVYDNMAGQGWAFFAYGTPPENKNNFNVTAKGQGLNGTNAACAEVNKGGAITFWSRGAGVPGFQPFSGTKAISFWAKTVGGEGATPPLEIVVSGDPTLPTNGPRSPEDPANTHCYNNVWVSNLTPVESSWGGWGKYEVPLSAFNCPSEEVVSRLNKLDWMATERTTFCLDDVYLV